MGDVAPVEHHRATIGLDDPADRLEQRALARAVRAEQGDDLALLDVDVHAEQHLASGVAGVEVAHDQQIGLALTALVQRLAARRGRLPHLGDVGVDGVLRRAQDEAADDEQRDEHEHAPADPEVAADPPDDRQDEQAGDDPQRGDAEAGGTGPSRDGQRQRDQNAGPDDRERSGDDAVERDGDDDVGGDREPDGRHGREHGDVGEELDQPLHVAHEVLGDVAGTEDEAHQTGTARRSPPPRRERARRGRTAARTAVRRASRTRSGPSPGTAGSTTVAAAC